MGGKASREAFEGLLRRVSNLATTINIDRERRATLLMPLEGKGARPSYAGLLCNLFIEMPCRKAEQHA